MDFLINLFQFVIVLGLLLFVHEAGHFLVARALKIEVEEFGFGIPPRIVRLFRLWGTDFTLNWIPFGAFVRPKGELDPDVPGGLASAPPLVKLAVLLGGPAMNLLMGLVLLVYMFASVGTPNPKLVEIIQTSPGSPAAAAGIQSGDVILKVNDTPIDSIAAMQTTIQAFLGQEIAITYQRGSQEGTVRMTPRAKPPTGQGPLGVQLGNKYEPMSVSQALPAAASATLDQGRQLLLMPVNLIRGTIAPDQARIVGIKGIYDMYTAAGQMDAAAASAPVERPAVFRLSIVAAIAIALGFTNLLPIPALDGGRILFVLPELLFRKRIPARFETLVNMVGLGSLLLLMVYITVQDFINPVVLR